MNLQIIEIDSEIDLPEGMKLQVYDGSLDDAKARFLTRHSFDCKVAFLLRGRWWMVMDPDYRIEVNG
jgi:hypothetical protein